MFMLHKIVALTAALALGRAQDLSWVPYNQTQFDNHQFLATDLVLHWKVSPDGDTTKTRFGVAARTDGYLALGFSEVGGMKGAQIALGRNVDGDFKFQSMKATGFVTPQELETSDMELLEGSSNGSVVGFTFNKNTTVDCISMLNDVHLDGQMFLWAKGASNDFQMHTQANRGARLVTLNDNSAQQFQTAVGHDFGSALKWEVHQPNITVPARETSYCYSLHKVPDGATRYHIIGDIPHVDTNLVHHLVVLGCNGLPFTTSEASALQQQAVCDFSFRRCNAYIAEWAPGNQGRVFPDDFGLPIGSALNFEYVLLEIHYNNPTGAASTVDSSGLDLYYTTTLRQTEVGSLTTGDLQAGASLWNVAPGQNMAMHEFDCPGECTTAGLSQDITVMGGVYHMHQHGTQMDLSVIRNGTEVERIRRVKDFDFNYQPFTPLNFTIKPGDRLMTRCFYNTSQATTAVSAGIGSNDEMCMFFMAYYPRQELSLCDGTKRWTGTEYVNDTICLRNSISDQWLRDTSVNLMAPYEALPERTDACSGELSGAKRVGLYGTLAAVTMLVAVFA